MGSQPTIPPRIGGRTRGARVWRGAESRRRAARRRLGAIVLLLLAIAAFVVGLWVGGSDGHSSTNRALSDEYARNRETRLVIDGRTILLVPAPSGAARGAEVRRRLPHRLSVRRGAATIVYRIDVAAAARAASSREAEIDIPRTAVASRIATPVVPQELRNNCETAALEALLKTAGRRQDQLQLQRALPVSPPLDPRETAAGRRVWGDPDRGFVGRADGGGTAGGFGVYPGPIAALAARRGVRLRSLSGDTPGRVYAQLLAGNAVMAWVGLGAGPYAQWRSAAGRRIEVNLNEHVVVLAGITSDGQLRVMNPLAGTRELWTKPRFEMMWARLGRRALVT